MNPILLAVLLVAGLGLIAGLVLAVASVLMAVPRDEKAEALRECLPGANCGACGYSGCDGYAKAMAHEGAKVGLCSPGGEQVAAATAAILGVSAETETKTALVRCGGCEEFTTRKLEYKGIPTCAAASQFYGGDWLCNYGCLGYGDCPVGLRIRRYYGGERPCPHRPGPVPGLQPVRQDLPQGPDHLGSRRLPRAWYGAAATTKGAQVRKACKVGCIACMRCTKACQYDAIHVDNFLASIDPEKCVGCGRVRRCLSCELH